MMRIIREYEPTEGKLAELEDGTWWWIGHSPKLKEVKNSGWNDLDMRSPKAYADIKSGVLKPYWIRDGYGWMYQPIQVILKVKNNDGRDICYSCAAPTKTIMGFSDQYQVCTACGK